MPSIKDESTVDAIAREFCSNGRKQEEAMVTIGYAKGYARSYCGQMWANPLIKAAIAKIDAKNQAKSERTVQQLDDMYAEAYRLGQRCKQPAAMNGSVTGIARLYGMDKDAGISGKDVPKPITAADLALLRSMARAITDRELAQPVLDVAVEGISVREGIR